MSGWDRQKERRDLRRGPDLRVRMLKWFAVASWGVFFFLLLVVEKARPRFETFFDRFYGIHLRTTWNEALLPTISGACGVGLLICLAGLAAGIDRYRRKGDGVPLSLTATALAFLLSLIVLLFYRAE